MRFINTLVALCSAAVFFSGVTIAQTVSTHAAPPKTVKTAELRLLPAIQVPENPDKYQWKVTSKINGHEVSDGSVMVYSFDSAGFRQVVGTIPEGTEIKLDTFRRGGRHNYYAIPFKGQIITGTDAPKATDVAWVSGLNIVAVGYSSTAK